MTNKEIIDYLESEINADAEADNFGMFVCSTEVGHEIIAMLKEQKHGEWITIWDRNDPDTSHEGRCSICKRISNRPLGGYCKWCGAIMDKEFGL